MKKFLLELLDESSNLSMTRLLSLGCVCIASAIAIYAVAAKQDLSAASILCGTFLGAGMGAKVVQRFAEK